MYLISEEQFDELKNRLPSDGDCSFLIGQIFKQYVHEPENRDKTYPDVKRILRMWLDQNKLLDQSIGLTNLAKETQLLLDQLED